MFDRFGEYNTAEELNKAAEGLRQEGDIASLEALALENGLDKEDAEDFINGYGYIEELATPLMAALGKIKIESKELIIEGILKDWEDTIIATCMNDEKMQVAVRRNEKSLAECMARLIRFAFENKVRVSEKIVKITKVTHNGKEENMRSPLYLGIPNRVQVEKIVREYYLG